MDDETIRLVDGLRCKMEEFEFVFFLFAFEQLFAHTDVVFDILQHKSMDITFCKRRIEKPPTNNWPTKLKVESVFDKIYTRAATQTDDQCWG